MAGTNPTDVVDDDKEVTEDDLRALKYPDEEVETTQVEDETSEGDDVTDETEETDDESQTDEEESSFVKEFDYIKGDTPEEYAKNLEAAYKNSTSEAMRLKGELDATKQAPPVNPTEKDESSDEKQLSPTDLYVQQKLDEEIQSAFDKTRQEYPQVGDPTEYDKFTKKVATFSRTILDSESRLASPSELYNLAAVSLGWEKQGQPDSKDKLNMAVKDSAATGKSTSASPKPGAKLPKISEAELKLNRMMYPGKTDKEIIEELAPYH